MADIYWDRLEPHTRSEHLEEGLQTRIADALWMLGRQWQFGEFRGEDAASPIHARVRVSSAPLVSFRNEAVPFAKAEPLRDGHPLEARVEAELVASGPAALALRAEGGLAFLRRLDRASLSHLRAGLRKQFSLDVSTEVLQGLPEPELRRLRLLSRRALDASKLLSATNADLLAAGATAAELPSLRQILEQCRGEVGARFVEPGASGDVWNDERLEYSFSVAASAAPSEVVLDAREYAGGHLDWYTFDVASGKTHGLTRTPLREQELQLLPVPLSYAGMPAARFWELEDGAVHFGSIEAGPADLARLVVAELATLYSDDWFLLPVRLPHGSVTRVTALDLLDTFGTVHPVQSAAVLDQQTLRPGEERPWAYFELAGDPSAGAGQTPWLLLPPALVGSMHSVPVESVSFVRDEAANLCWAIEESIEAPTGRPFRRRLQAGLGEDDAATGPKGTPLAPAAPVSTDDPWRYRLETAVPPFWVPLVPERLSESSSSIRLRRGRMLAWDSMDRAIVGAQGRILRPERALWLHEEEVPTTGVQVTRRWQLGRGVDGGVYLWMARRKRPGRGERGSGLRFDTMERWQR